MSSLASGEVTQVTLYAQWEKIQQVSRPVASVYTGSIVTEGTAVVLSCGESGAEIYYTTDNTVPTKDSCLYTSPIEIYEDMVIKAVAFKDGYQNSEVAVFEYFLKEKTQYTILFDKNRSDAEGTMSSQTFEEGSGVFLNKNLFSCTGYNFVGWNTSADGSGTFYADRTAVSRMEFDGTTMTLYAQWERILKVSTPKADIASGSVVEYQTQVTLSCGDEEVEIHYTTDGSIPTKDSPEYTTPIVITEAITIKAVAFREGDEDSDVLEVSYTVAVENSVYTILFGFDMESEKVITLYAQWKKMEQLTAPVADVKNGSTVRKGTKVSLEHSLKQVQIYYTTDGTLPTTDSNFYVEPVVIEEDTVITAIAVKENYMPSEPVEFIYKVADTGELLEEDIPAGRSGSLLIIWQAIRRESCRFTWKSRQNT